MSWIDCKKEYGVVSQNWIMPYLKMFKISSEVLQFIENSMENWRVKQTAGGKSLTEVKIQRGIFQRYALSSLLFVIAMMWLNHILRKCTGGYKLTKLQEKINLMFMDDSKLFAKNEKELVTWLPAVRVYSPDIGIEFGLEKYSLLIRRSENREMTKGIELPNQDKIWMIWE